MSSGARLEHSALRGYGGEPLATLELTDQHRLAILLQAAALLAHLEHGGWKLPHGWEKARVTAEGVLRVSGIVQGRDDMPAQQRLRRLIRRLFRVDGELAGRGEARRAARWLLERWGQNLVPSSADAAVAGVLEAAPFLWQPAFAIARRALAGLHNGSEVWVAGPGPVRRRFLAAGDTHLHTIETLLGGPEARDLWDGLDANADPSELMEHGRWLQAAAAWRRRPPDDHQQALAFARCLFALGKYSQALAALGRPELREARLLQAWCKLYLGELSAAYETIRSLESVELPVSQAVELAEVAIRVLGNRGQHDAIRGWVVRLFEDPRLRGEVRLHAHIVAAEASWDCRDMEGMDLHLDAGASARQHTDLAWRWHQASALRAQAAGHGTGVVEHIGAALRGARRRLLRAEAGRLWSDLAVGRTLADDLPGAERACRHAFRLLSSCEGASRSTLGLYNLAEVRLRRGRLEGVETVLETSTLENRRAGNPRALIRDLELWVRLELGRGRLVEALARYAEARDLIDASGLDERHQVLEVLAARAYGWLGRAQPAAACLENVGDEALGELEPEERPAVCALAGQGERAGREAAETEFSELWRSLVAGIAPNPAVWQRLSGLEPYRAARLVFDCECTLPGVAPPQEVRWAIAELRRAGAEGLAEKLEDRSRGAWRALDDYLERAIPDLQGATELLADAGYPDVRLSWIRGDQTKILIPGGGGDIELSSPFEGGELTLHTRVADPTLRTLFSLIRRDLVATWNDAESGLEKNIPEDDGIVGESASIQQALDRLDQLAGGNLPVLILGESGTGKELFARRAHRLSHRAEKPYQAINCAALSESLILSELFGHARGAFTGAGRDHKGLFESARGGTLFLDEIGDLPASAQGNLLRFLQEGEIRRVGESYTRKVDVRVVAATHRDLEQMVRDGTFRQDLFFRLKVATIRLPPLRDRGNDVLILADYFLRDLSAPKPPRKIAALTRTKLLTYTWPGNIRELRNVLEVAAALASGAEILPEHLDLPEQAPDPAGDYHQQLEHFRKQLIADALAHCQGNRSEAARRLGLSRQALSYLARRFGFS